MEPCWRPRIFPLNETEDTSPRVHFRNGDDGEFSSGIVYVVRKKVTNGPTRVDTFYRLDVRRTDIRSLVLPTFYELVIEYLLIRIQQNQETILLHFIDPSPETTKH